MRRIWILALACMSVGALALPSVASASRTQETIFEDDQLLLLRGEQVQTQILDELRFLGVDTIRVLVLWKLVVPGTGNETARPSGDPNSPSYYNTPNTAMLDRLVREAQARGIGVILNPAASALRDVGTRFGLPRWARRADGSPNTVEFERFMRGMARRYNGTFPGAPKVGRWSIWNEPNQGGWLQPQWANGVPRSAITYRDLYNRGRRALLATPGHRGSALYFGELAPIGRERGPGARRNRTSPISPGRFLREVVCVDDRIRAFRGRDRSRRRNCTGAAIRASGFAYHPYTKGRGTTATSRGNFSDEFPSGNVRGLISLVDRIANRTGRLPRGMRFYSTEFGFQSNPPDRFSGVSQTQQAQYENEHEYLLYKQPRFRAFMHYLMLDDPCGRVRCGGFQTGLKRQNGVLKPAYNAFQMPIVVVRTTRAGTLKVWGAVRGRRAGATAALHVNDRFVKNVRGGARGYFTTTIRASSSARVQIIDVTDTGGAARSRVARVSSRALGR